MRVLPMLAGRVLLRVHGRAERLRGPRPLRRPAAVDRAAAERVRGRLRDLRARHRRRDVRPRRGAGRAGPDRRPRACTARGSPSRRAARSASSSSSTWRGPTRGSRAHGPRVPARDGPHPRARSIRSDADMVIAVPTTGHSAAQGYSEVSGHPVRRRPLQEQLRGPHLHPAVADAAGPRRQAQAQPAARFDPRQAAGGGRRLDRPRHHHEAGRGGAARSRAPPRCTSASPARRCSGRASTASTCPPARS